MRSLTMEIKLARLRLNMNQTDLAQKLGLTKNRFVTIENKKEHLQNMTLKRFLNLCKVLDEEFRNAVLQKDYLLTMFEREE